MNDDDLISKLEDKIEMFRLLVSAWNPTSLPIWEHPMVKKIGEKESDYSSIDDSEIEQIVQMDSDDFVGFDDDDNNDLEDDVSD